MNFHGFISAPPSYDIINQLAKRMSAALRDTILIYFCIITGDGADLQVLPSMGTLDLIIFYYPKQSVKNTIHYF